MNDPELHPGIEQELRQTSTRWKWIHFWRELAWAAAGTAVFVAILAAASWRGWITHPVVAFLALAGVLVLGGTAFLAVLIRAIIIEKPRTWIARHLEDAHAPLLDRLHVLIFLRARRRREPPVTLPPSMSPESSPESSPGEDREGTTPSEVPESYVERIERQAYREMGWILDPFAGERRRVGLFRTASLALLVLAFFLWVRVEPWEARSSMIDEGPAGERVVPELEPGEDATEVEEPAEPEVWGEVRITEPGRDLKVTKVDVVPLRIEAAASEPLDEVAWLTAVNGAEPTTRELPEPAEPRYAVFDPLLYVDELYLSDWDVVSYHATADVGPESFASEIYFLEVRPFREELEKLRSAGGAGSDAYHALSGLSGLLDRQKRILRETHRHFVRPPRGLDQRRQDLDTLVWAESELAESVRHLYAETAAKLENHDIGVVLDQLAQAEEHLETAVDVLREGSSEAVRPEQEALQALIESRKSFQRFLNENPEAFDGSSPPEDEEPFPTAELEDQLEEISEYRDEEKAALERLDKLIEEQREISDRIDPSDAAACRDLAPSQGAGRQALEDFENQHPGLAGGVGDEMQAAHRALDDANEALRDDPAAAPGAQQQAIDALEELRDAVRDRAAGRQLTHAYKLKEMLERQAREMGEVEKDPGARTAAEVRELAESARSTLDELAEIVDRGAGGRAFGPPLRETLSDERRSELDSQLDALAETSGEGRSDAARKSREGLEDVSEAFEESLPRTAREVRERDALQPQGLEALDEALRQLQSLLDQAGRGSSGSGHDAERAADLERQQAEALENLRRGMRERYGRTEETAVLLEEAEETLRKVGGEVDPVKLRRLLERIERIRVEMSETIEEVAGGEISHIDPADLPASYRERIQSYFRKLSEQ